MVPDAAVTAATTVPPPALPYGLRLAPVQPRGERRGGISGIARAFARSAVLRTPIVAGGASFCTHKLQRVCDSRFEFRATVGVKLFSLFFLLAGLALLAGAALVEATNGRLGLLLLGPVFGVAGAGLLYHHTRPIVFDKGSGYFWKGRKDPRRASLPGQAAHFTRLGDIQGIQLVLERCDSQSSLDATPGSVSCVVRLLSKFCQATSFGGEDHDDRCHYYSYELNLVLQNGTRVNVIDHGNRERILADAQTLAAFLGVSVLNEI